MAPAAPSHALQGVSSRFHQWARPPQEIGEAFPVVTVMGRDVDSSCHIKSGLQEGPILQDCQASPLISAWVNICPLFSAGAGAELHLPCKHRVFIFFTWLKIHAVAQDSREDGTLTHLKLPQEPRQAGHKHCSIPGVPGGSTAPQLCLIGRCRICSDSTFRSGWCVDITQRIPCPAGHIGKGFLRWRVRGLNEEQRTEIFALGPPTFKCTH